MNQNIILIVDRSCSIESFTNSYLNTINGIISLQKSRNPNGLFSMIFFNDYIHYMYLNQTFNNVRDDLSRETLNLNGLTSFYDSVYTIIDRMLAIFLNNRQSPPIVIIITDGDDTSSKYVAQEQLVTQINIAKNYGWQFIFFGMTDRSMIVGRHLNFNTCVQYSSDSLVKIPFLIESLINQRVPTTDLDIRGLEQTFQKMDLN